jgi:hypothetical protein
MKIAAIVIITVVVPGAYVTIEIGNSSRWVPGDANPTLILLTGEAAEPGRPT